MRPGELCLPMFEFFFFARGLLPPEPITLTDATIVAPRPRLGRNSSQLRPPFSCAPHKFPYSTPCLNFLFESGLSVPFPLSLRHRCRAHFSSRR